MAERDVSKTREKGTHSRIKRVKGTRGWVASPLGKKGRKDHKSFKMRKNGKFQVIGTREFQGKKKGKRENHA